MQIEAVAYNNDYYCNNVGLTNDVGNDSISDFLKAGDATKESKSSDEGKTIGLTLVGNIVYMAKYADSSTSADPVIKVGDYEVHVNNVNPDNATELEMFALMSYMEDSGMIEKHGMASFSKMKAYSMQSECDGICSGIYDEPSFWDKKQNWSDIIQNAKVHFASMPATYSQSAECGRLLSYFEKWNVKSNSQEILHNAIQKYTEARKITAKELKEESDWREMSDDEWNQMMEDVDKYIDSYKKYLKEMREKQDEAAKKAAMEARPDMKTLAAASASLNAAVNGLESGVLSDFEDNEENTSAEDGLDHEKDWTKKLDTDDQTILGTAKIAQDMKKMAISKLQEVQLTDNTVPGISHTDNITECAYLKENEKNQKEWTITVYTEQGIISNKCINGKIEDHWELKYTNPDDAKKVWDFLDQFEDYEDLEFAGSKEFWMDFI